MNLITDRTQADVMNAKQIVDKIRKGTATTEERNAFFNGLKGYYNAIDLNRVESAVGEISTNSKAILTALKQYAEDLGVAWDKIFELPFNPNEFNPTIKTDWDIDDFFDKPNQDRYLQNVEEIRGLAQASGTVPTSFQRFNYARANEVEQALVNTEAKINADNAISKQRIDKTAKSWYYSNDIFAGEIV